MARLRELFPNWDDDTLQPLARTMHVKTLPAGTPFLRTGEVPQAAAYVTQGLLKAVYHDADGNRVNINFFSEGMGVCDYQAFREQTGSRYDFLAIENSTLILLPRAVFEQPGDSAPALEHAYRILLEQALFAYIRRTERFLITDAKARYLDFVRAEPGLFRRLSVSDLCSYLGLSRQTLTRIRKQLLTAS